MKVDAYAVLPPNLDRSKKYPLFIYVYGEPAGQTTVNRWPGPGGMWHWMLAQQGYVVMSIDNRGTTAPRGNAWRKSIYRTGRHPQPPRIRRPPCGRWKDRPYLDCRPRGRVG